MKFTFSEGNLPTWVAGCGAANMDKKIVVPEGMLKAAMEEFRRNNGLIASLEAALRWLSENPIVPTAEQQKEMYDRKKSVAIYEAEISWFCKEWQRRMFLAQEPEIPEEVKDLWIDTKDIYECRDNVQMIAAKGNRRMIEAFRRGQRSK